MRNEYNLIPSNYSVSVFSRTKDLRNYTLHCYNKKIKKFGFNFQIY